MKAIWEEYHRTKRSDAELKELIANHYEMRFDSYWQRAKTDPASATHIREDIEVLWGSRINTLAPELREQAWKMFITNYYPPFLFTGQVRILDYVEFLVVNLKPSKERDELCVMLLRHAHLYPIYGRLLANYDYPPAEGLPHLEAALYKQMAIQFNKDPQALIDDCRRGRLFQPHDGAEYWDFDTAKAIAEGFKDPL